MVLENQKATPVTFEDKTYRLEEMCDAIDQSVVNINNVIKQQKKLISIVNHSKHKDEFKEFVRSCNNQVTNLQQQRDAINEEQAILKVVIDMCHNNEECKKAVMLVLTALRVFDSVPTPVEQTEGD